MHIFLKPILIYITTEWNGIYGLRFKCFETIKNFNNENIRLGLREVYDLYKIMLILPDQEVERVAADYPEFFFGFAKTKIIYRFSNSA